jgi:hypothetical protein
VYNKLDRLLDSPHHNMGLISDWNDGTIDRIVDILEGYGEHWNRGDNKYRDHVSRSKYVLNKVK